MIAGCVPHWGKGGSIIEYLSMVLPTSAELLGWLKHIAVIDRFYMSPFAAIYMRVFRGIHVVGTCMRNRQGYVARRQWVAACA